MPISKEKLELAILAGYELGLDDMSKMNFHNSLVEKKLIDPKKIEAPKMLNKSEIIKRALQATEEAAK